MDCVTYMKLCCGLKFGDDSDEMHHFGSSRSVNIDMVHPNEFYAEKRYTSPICARGYNVQVTYHVEWSALEALRRLEERERKAQEKIDALRNKVEVVEKEATHKEYCGVAKNFNFDLLTASNMTIVTQSSMEDIDNTLQDELEKDYDW